MPDVSKLVMRKFYRKAEGHPEKLPWHQEAPPEILKKAVSARCGAGLQPASGPEQAQTPAPHRPRALDVGCGAGVFSVWMAEQGMEVTGIDLFPEAVAMARARADKHGVNPQFIAGDLFAYAPDQHFDLVHDSGCLHSLVGGSLNDYKRQLLRWLAIGGDYVLGHWGKRHRFDWRPIGPRRRSAETIKNLFAPELEVREIDVVDFETPLPFGPVVRGVGYWFTRVG